MDKSIIAPELDSPVSQLESELFIEQSSPSLEIGLFNCFILIARRKRRVGSVAGVSFIVGLSIALLLPTKYTATTKILTPQQTPSSAALMMNQMTAPGAASLAAAAGGLGFRNPNDIYIGMLTSRPVADSLIQKFGLIQVYKEANITESRRELASHTSVSSEKSGFIAISVTEPNKQLAADLANAYTEQLRAMNKSLALTEASQRRLFYEEQLKHAREDLVEAEVDFRKIQERNGVVHLDAQAKAMILNATTLRAEIAAKQVEVQTLRAYSTERNPGLQLAEGQLATMQAEATRLEQHGSASGASGLGLQDVAGAGVEFLRAEHNVQYRQTMLDLLLRQYDAARLDESKYPAVIQVVEPAVPPERKSSPHRVLIVFAFLASGMIGACVWVLAGSIIARIPDLRQPIAELKSALGSK